MSALLQFAVPGFIFISGYFGVSFSLSKIVRLYSIIVYTRLIVPVLGGALFAGNYCQDVLRLWRPEGGSWFLNAYVVMMVLACLFGKVFSGVVWSDRDERMGFIRTCLPMLVTIFVWGALANYNSFRLVVPRVTGLQPGSFMTFFGIYVVGRLFRISKIEERMLTRRAIAIALLCGAAILGFRFMIAGVNQLASLIFAVCLFVVFKRMTFPNWLGNIVLFSSPMMFLICCVNGSLYFPGMDATAFSFIESAKAFFVSRGMSCWIAEFLAACAVFVVSLAVAIPWLVSAKVMKRWLSRFYGILDCLYEKSVSMLSRLMDGGCTAD